MTTNRANLFGGLAILSWGGLGLLGALSANLPPYIVLAFSFGIAACIGGVLCWVKGIRPVSLVNRSTVISATLLTAYHLTYLEAFHHADAIVVSLINYLWPACLILVGTLFFKLQSSKYDLLGAALGFIGVSVLVAKDGLSLNVSDLTGYLLAFVGALMWATYSNFRRHESTPLLASLTSVSLLSCLFCSAWAIASIDTSIEISSNDILVILLLGIGPAGGAFFLWDIGMRYGLPSLLGIMGFFAPVLSTLLMAFAGLGEWSWQIVFAVTLITIGGIVSQLDKSKLKELSDV